MAFSLSIQVFPLFLILKATATYADSSLQTLDLNPYLLPFKSCFIQVVLIDPINIDFRPISDYPVLLTANIKIPFQFTNRCPKVDISIIVSSETPHSLPHAGNEIQLFGSICKYPNYPSRPNGKPGHAGPLYVRIFFH